MTHLELAGVERVGEVRPLWLDLHHHHQAVVGTLPLVADDESPGSAAARSMWIGSTQTPPFSSWRPSRNTVVGYALVCIEAGPDDTFPVGERYAELYSLSVAAKLRGQGIGTRLLEFVDRELARRGIDDLKVAVMAGNVDAARLYERRGLLAAEVVFYRFGPRPIA